MLHTMYQHTVTLLHLDDHKMYEKKVLNFKDIKRENFEQILKMLLQRKDSLMIKALRYFL